MEGSGMLPVGAGRANRLGGQTHTTLMKKLFSLVLIAIVAFVAGCNKADTGAGGGAASTNAPAK